MGVQSPCTLASVPTDAIVRDVYEYEGPPLVRVGGRLWRYSKFLAIFP